MEEGTPDALRKEIAQIEQQLAEKKTQLEKDGADLKSAEFLSQAKENLKEIVGEKFQLDALPPAANSAANSGGQSINAPSHLPADFKITLQQLVNTAFSDGISQAANKAKATNNPALIDAFHDLIVDHLFDILVEREIIKRF